MKIVQSIGLIAVGLLAAACAGRTATIQPVTTSADASMGCGQLNDTAQNLATSARAKINANNSSDDGDTAIAIGSVLLLPIGLLAMDTKNADGTEGNNMIDRIAHLKTVASSKGCDTSGWPILTRYQ